MISFSFFKLTAAYSVHKDHFLVTFIILSSDLTIIAMYIIAEHEYYFCSKIMLFHDYTL